jgi:hypothetical protein
MNKDSNSNNRYLKTTITISTPDGTGGDIALDGRRAAWRAPLPEQSSNLLPERAR